MSKGLSVPIPYEQFESYDQVKVLEGQFKDQSSYDE